MTITNSKFIEFDDGSSVQYIEGYCDSNEDKPTDGIADGSNLIETDTGDWYFYNEASTTWSKMTTINTEAGS